MVNLKYLLIHHHHYSGIFSASSIHVIKLVKDLLFLFSGLSSTQDVLLTHGDTVTQVAPGFREIAKSGNLVAGVHYIRSKYLEMKNVYYMDICDIF